MREILQSAGLGNPAVAAAVKAQSLRTVVVVTSDAGLRGRLRDALTGMRWQVHEAKGGAEAFVQIDALNPEAVLVDSWLPDLEAGEFSVQLQLSYPQLDLLSLDGVAGALGQRSPRRNELLHALRVAQADAPMDGAAWLSAPVAVPQRGGATARMATMTESPALVMPAGVARTSGRSMGTDAVEPVFLLPEMVGGAAAMRELALMVRLVAPRSATVLIEGETGTGKEVVAKAIHRLSDRYGKPFVTLNCAAIPESLLEAELFGHTRGAFTGAVQSRTGRIEAAHGGTLFLDEIGEMPVALQAKLLRFLESGELQRIGDNEPTRVDVRVIAATHQPLEEHAETGKFRLDLYHRLAVFPVEIPPLRERMEDLPMLTEYLLTKLGEAMPRRCMTAEAIKVLVSFDWPGNVRELAHVLERAVILCGDRLEITADEIRLRSRRRTERSPLMQ